MATLGGRNQKTVNDNESSKLLLSNHPMNGNISANHSDSDSDNGIGREDDADDGHDAKRGSTGSSIERGELLVEEEEEMKEEEEEEEVDDKDDNNNNDTAQKEEEEEDESEMSPLHKNKAVGATVEGAKKRFISSTTKDDEDEDNDIGGITPHSSLPSSSSCCRKLSLLLLLIFVFPIGLLLITQLMDRIVWALKGDALTTTTTTTTSNELISSSNKQLPMSISLPVPLPYYDEEEAKKYVFYSKIAFCTEHAITTWTCGYMCDTVPIISTRRNRTTTIEGNYNDSEHPQTNMNKPPTNKNMIRYIPEGRKYGVQGYVAQLPTTSTTTTLNDLSEDAGAGAGAGDNNNNNNNVQKCIVAFRGSLSKKNWYADFLILLRPWPTNTMRKNFTTTTTSSMHNTNTTTNNTNDVDWCQGCKAHHGFASAYDELRYDVYRAIEELQCTSLVLTGHSLGAAIATLASLDLRAVSGYQVEATWTYGLPRVGKS